MFSKHVYVSHVGRATKHNTYNTIKHESVLCEFNLFALRFFSFLFVHLSSEKTHIYTMRMWPADTWEIIIIVSSAANELKFAVT